MNRNCEHCGAAMQRTTYYVTNRNPINGPTGRWPSRYRTNLQWKKKRFCNPACASKARRKIVLS